ncbi:MAG: hypothetical protein JXA68_05775 [Ignavibacteriales bacterium]|nr:hypothetical protein [Ignavibacteriales bacterium]
MKIQLILIIFLINLFNVRSYSDNDISEEAKNISVSLPHTFIDVWSALLMSLKQDSAQIRYINSQEGCIKTEFICLPSTFKDSIVVKQLTSMTKYEKNLAIWSDEICYSFIISVSSQDSLNTHLDVNTELYIYESNTMDRKILFQSNGSLEKEIIDQTKINLIRLQNEKEIIIPSVNDFLSLGSFSGEAECVINKSQDEVWVILLKIIRDNSLSIDFKDQSFGILTTQNASIIEDQKKVFLKEELVDPFKGWEKALALWTDDYEFSLRISVTPLQEDLLKSKVCLRTYIERYEYNTTNKWYLFKSTGVFENSLLSALQLSMNVFAPMDQIPYYNVHLDSVVTCIYNKPISIVWNSIMKSIKDNNLKMSYFKVDSCIYGITRYKLINDIYSSLEFIIEKISEDQCKISITSSNLVDNPSEQKIGIRYKKSSNLFIKDFLKNLSAQPGKKYTQGKDINEFVNESFYQSEIPDSEVVSFINDIEIIKSISLIPDYELFPKGILVNSEAGELNLVILGYIRQPFEFESSDNIMSSITDWVFHRLVYNLGNLLYYQFKEVTMFDSIVLDTKLKIYNLDDSTPIDMSYHTYQVKVNTADLINLVKFKTNAENTINSSIIKFEGENVDIY